MVSIRLGPLAYAHVNSQDHVKEAESAGRGSWDRDELSEAAVGIRSVRVEGSRMAEPEPAEAAAPGRAVARSYGAGSARGGRTRRALAGFGRFRHSPRDSLATIQPPRGGADADQTGTGGW
ncbi:hypothetical protein LAUMK13_02200 [Mycobacterium innocens]|uniref:Uncharacterized protein n=1 Tax=Mycobacterium innocens TaxID=2341083 RepID=A0A498PXU7_9MYCO|nr:hypothetical protein LAUMK13_02200 [Mycobacterium innocens]